jgi:hypothetical protein
MDLKDYVFIDDPMERLRKLNQKIREDQREIIELSPLRNAALIECHEAGIHPTEICQAAGFTLARMRNIFRQVGYKPKVNYKENQKATQYKPNTSASFGNDSKHHMESGND